MTKIIIRDRNNVAYLLANGFECEFIANASSGGIEAQFHLTPEIEISNKEYMSNRGVPVQSFVAACRYISDRIRDHRNGGQR